MRASFSAAVDVKSMLISVLSSSESLIAFPASVDNRRVSTSETRRKITRTRMRHSLALLAFSTPTVRAMDDCSR
jgi:hypothetical protein